MALINTQIKPFNATAFQNGEFVEVSDQNLNGKWAVFFFYPADFTFVCPTEIVEFSNNVEEFEDRDAVLVGGSADNEFCHLAWRNDHEDLRELKIPLIAAPKLARELGILDPVENVCLRATFIVDPHGVVQYAAANNLSVGRNVKEVLRILRRELEAGNVQKWRKMMACLNGVSEETTTGVHRLEQMSKAGTLLCKAINVNDCVTKSKFDNKYGIRHSLPDGLNRATDALIGGKVAFVAGYGDVGKGAAEALRGQGARVIVSEIDPICALQAAMDGFQVARLEDVIGQVDILITGTGNRNVVTVDHLLAMKHLAIVANVGHFDNEIDMAGLESLAGTERVEIKPQVHEWRLPTGRSVLVLSEGRLMNLGNATGHPSFVMSASFTNQVLAQIELWTKRENYPLGVATLPKALDEKVARLHLPALGVQLTQLSGDQAAYIGVPVEGPYKLEHYRY